MSARVERDECTYHGLFPFHVAFQRGDLAPGYVPAFYLDNYFLRDSALVIDKTYVPVNATSATLSLHGIASAGYLFRFLLIHGAVIQFNDGDNTVGVFINIGGVINRYSVLHLLLIENSQVFLLCVEP